MCPDDDCGEYLIKVINAELDKDYTTSVIAENLEEWFALPRKGSARPVDDLVPDKYKRDYQEASLILGDSPRMSAVLARRILADLLEEYAECKQYGLADRIDAFVKDTNHPRDLRKNLHYVREVGDFGAHTKTDVEGQIIDIESEEAEWTLDVIDNLFDYFIIGPERDADRRAGVTQKMEQAGRRPIKPLPEDENGE
ncbi:MAG: DUF4145 domain-containing protein [Chloroflexi bacterium]|nr:DUF4145 domain-containing protein [Chloroflexota bacterium]